MLDCKYIPEHFLHLKFSRSKLWFTKIKVENLEWDIFNPDRLINLEINNKSGLSNNLDIHNSKVPSSGHTLRN